MALSSGYINFLEILINAVIFNTAKKMKQSP